MAKRYVSIVIVWSHQSNNPLSLYNIFAIDYNDLISVFGLAVQGYFLLSSFVHNMKQSSVVL